MTGTEGTIAFRGGAGASELITVAAVGDVLLHDAVQKFAMTRPDGFQSLFHPVADLIQGADIAFANLEGPAAAGITKTGRATAPPDRLWDDWVYSGYPMFNYHPSVAPALKQAGFDVLLTANNHSLDCYAIGVERTIDAIEAAGLKFTGTRRRGETERPWYTVTEVAKDGETRRIAWLGCTYGTNGLPDRHGQVLLCYKDKARLLGIIEALARRDDIDAVMFAPHWGVEYEHAPEARQRAFARAAIEAGATAVIGTHPHVMQPVEKACRKADGREGLIAYSLGNFVSNQISLARRSSMILLLGLMPDTEPGSKPDSNAGFGGQAAPRRLRLDPDLGAQRRAAGCRSRRPIAPARPRCATWSIWASIFRSATGCRQARTTGGKMTAARPIDRTGRPKNIEPAPPGLPADALTMRTRAVQQDRTRSAMNEMSRPDAAESGLLPDVLPLCRDALVAAEGLKDAARQAVAGLVAPGGPGSGRVDPALLEREQFAAHGLAWFNTYVAALEQTLAWAERLEAAGRLGEGERLIVQAGFGEYLAQLRGGIAISQGENPASGRYGRARRGARGVRDSGRAGADRRWQFQRRADAAGRADRRERLRRRRPRR